MICSLKSDKNKTLMPAKQKTLLKQMILHKAQNIFFTSP